MLGLHSAHSPPIDYSQDILKSNYPSPLLALPKWSPLKAGDGVAHAQANSAARSSLSLRCPPLCLPYLYASVVVELSTDLTPLIPHSVFLPASTLFHSDLLHTPDHHFRYGRHFRVLHGHIDYNAIVLTTTSNYRLEFRVPASATRTIGSRVLRRKYVKADAILELFPDSF